ncbi:MAG: glycosyltransferase family 4 protein [Armatimonadetes bacterium]|nr:glycosyltransferase family 4 protein [Armatimonadota bacterium]
MRIAIDTRTLNSPKTGDRTVTLGLVKGLIGLAEAEGLELVLVGQEAPPEGLLPEAEAVRVHVAPKPRGYRWMLSAFPRVCREVGADVALIHYMGPFRSPCPFVTIIHDTVWRSLPETFPWRDRLIMNALIPGTIRRAAAVVAVSEFTRSEVERYYPAAKGKLHVVPNAIDERYRPVTEEAEQRRVRERCGLPERYVLSVGVLQPRKNVEGLIEAYGRLPEEVREGCGLVIAGKKGWMVERLVAVGDRSYTGPKTAVGDRSYTDTFFHPRFIGYVADEDLPALYSMAACFVYPSLYEGFGLPPLEAMACGTPVVTSNVASLPEVCGEAALLVDPREVSEIAEAMARVLTDEALRVRMIEAGRAQAGRYDWRESARRLVGVLRRSVGA